MINNYIITLSSLLKEVIGYISTRRLKMMVESFKMIYAANMVINKYLNKDYSFTNTAYMHIFSTIPNITNNRLDKVLLASIVKEAIEAINKSSAYVISVDINSGMNGDTGEATLAVKSDLTVSIGYIKNGLVTESAKRYISDLVNVDIGIVLVN